MSDTVGSEHGHKAGDAEQSSALTLTIEYVAQRRLVGAALLLLASHRPLAFPSSQLLRVLQPVADLLDVSACGEIASLLNDPEAVANLESMLAGQHEHTESNQTRQL